MKAFIIATVTVKDPKKFQQYAEKSKSTFDIAGAEILLKGSYQGTLTGQASHQSAAIITFKDQATLERWYQSKEYQELISLRDQAADITITQYSIPSMSN
ncbi:MAG TPA: DUF1330 domain-containing protein [Aeromonadales bacterium]|nr:DUF1330 domain-containing protein [Aeromonadales bacterium]